MLLTCRGALIFAQTSWDTPGSSKVYSTESSLSGSGVTQADWPAVVVAAVSRQDERRWFIRKGGTSARERALSQAGLRRDAGGCWLAGGRDEEAKLKDFDVKVSSPGCPPIGSFSDGLRYGRKDGIARRHSDAGGSCALEVCAAIGSGDLWRKQETPHAL